MGYEDMYIAREKANKELLANTPVRHERCKSCNRLVTAKMDVGFAAGGKQVMAFFTCACGSKWFYDTKRHDRGRARNMRS